MSDLAFQSRMEVVHQHISIRHLEQLTHLDLQRQAPPRLPEDDEIILTDLNELKKWSYDNIDAIEAAKASSCHGGPNGSRIDWNNVFLSFMETCASYLRDNSLLIKAVDAYREGDNEKALELYNKSTADIKALAKIWGMGFEMFADLVDEAPSGHSWWNGPFCAGFYSLDQTKPFIGGTDPGRMAEVLVDSNYQFVRAEGVLYNAHVSEGVYTGLFGKFKSAPQTPMALITEAVAEVARASDKTSVLHVTGHSLGGSYSTLCFTEFLRYSTIGQLPAKCSLGDIYTFGSPRLAQRDLGDRLVADLKIGSSWRIVNANDLVPQVPPIKFSLVTGIFNHIDGGMKIFKDKPTEKLPSELGTKPPSRIWPKPSELKAHQTDAYYLSWRNAADPKGFIQDEEVVED
ncbi:hypothetical protein FRB97_001622 [Tulasnella sp. 331]|nr:hypothetical protein FRB97_001622 [Tulasnella sp. 331]